MEYNPSKEIHWFIETLQSEFNVAIDTEDIGVEATELGVDEVENFYVPKEIFEVLPETFVYEIMIADDPAANVWVGAVAFYPESPDWCLQVVTKNDEMVFRKVLPTTH